MQSWRLRGGYSLGTAVDRYGPEIAKTYKVVGEPTTVEGFGLLAVIDRSEEPDDPPSSTIAAFGMLRSGSHRRGF